MVKTKQKKVQALIEKIARETCRVETLESRNMDALDFYDIGVGSLKDALMRAYQAGVDSQKDKGTS